MTIKQSKKTCKTQVIQVKRSSSNETPSSLKFGEFGYSHVNGKSKIFIGDSTDMPKEVAGDSYAKLDSPELIGMPKAPTAALGNNTNQIATTEFVVREVQNGATLTHGAVAVGDMNNKISSLILSPAQIIVGNTTSKATAVDVTGDVTISDTGVTTIKPNAVTAEKLAPNSVTAEKVAPEAITDAKLAPNAVTETKIAPNAVTAEKVAPEAITDAKLAPNAVTAEKLAPNSVTAEKVAPEAITDAKLAPNAVTETKIAPNAVTAEKVAPEAITAEKLAPGAVTAEKLALNSITNNILAKAGANTWKGNNTATMGDVADNPAGSLTEVDSTVLTITGGVNSILNNVSIAVKKANEMQGGYLSMEDWAKFNDKMNKVPTAISGNIANFNDMGEVKDSGYSVEDSLSNSATKIPTSNAVTKAINAAQAGLTVKESVTAATTVNLVVIASGSGATKLLTATVNGLLVIDGINTWVDMDNDGGENLPHVYMGKAASRVLIKNQTNAADNGIYVVKHKGSETAPYVLQRASDANSAETLVNGSFTFVSGGTVNYNKGFVFTVNVTFVIEETAIIFMQFSGAGELTAGTGLQIIGNIISVANDGISTDLIAPDAVTAKHLALNSVTAKAISSAALGNGLIGGSNTPISVKPDDVTGEDVAPLSVTMNGAGVFVDNCSITHTGGMLSVALIDGGMF